MMGIYSIDETLTNRIIGLNNREDYNNFFERKSYPETSCFESEYVSETLSNKKTYNNQENIIFRNINIEF